jgi:hypothetical protein
MNLTVAFLAPIFLTASGGDIQFARMAAFEPVNAWSVFMLAGKQEVRFIVIARTLATRQSAATHALDRIAASQVLLAMTTVRLQSG